MYFVIFIYTKNFNIRILIHKFLFIKYKPEILTVFLCNSNSYVEQSRNLDYLVLCQI